MKDHTIHLEIFSNACHRERLLLSEKISTIPVNKITILGILIDETRIELQKHIVKKIINFLDVLKDKKHLKSFLGIVNFVDFLTRDRAFEANSIFLRLRHLRKNLEELDKKFEQLTVKAQVAGQVQRVDLNTVQIAISTILVSSYLWNDLMEPIQKASPSVMNHELREHDSKQILRARGRC
ncbi:UNVERIFIED_CONTAM: hypothetical protein Scaly_0831900 [Sesamum calycinum]|uniref:Uncharacterized protein n=1 Tax=Sesamum calycinum TaxID=2727403 RepID=A0AAW2RB14_9LAMI